MSKYLLFYSISMIAVLLLSGCSDKMDTGSIKASQTRTVRAFVAAAAVSNDPVNYEASGTVCAQTASTLSSKIMGVVRRVYVKEGDRVNKDQVLMDIDPRQVTAANLQAEAALAEARKAETAAVSAQNAAQAAADLARTTYHRYDNLLKSEAVSLQEFDEVSARYAEAAQAQSQAMVDVSKSRIQQAEAAAATASVSEADSRITAPYAGVVISKLSDEGSLASPGTPLLKLDSAEVSRVDILIPENLLHSVKLFQPVTVVIPSAGITLTGTIQSMIPAADSASRSFTVQTAIAPHPSVHPGMFCRVLISQGSREKLLIPLTALLYQGQLTGIFLVDSDQIARFRILRTGLASGDMIEVISGIHPGDRYVVQPPPYLADGFRVEAAS